MLEYLITLAVGFWLGVSGFLYFGCYILEEVLDLPQPKGSESPSGAHERLKRLVQRVIEEAMALPAMLDYSGIRGRGGPDANSKLPDFDAKTYEDLLATAILNKVIDRYQHEYDRDRERSSGIHSESASPSGSHVDDEVDLNSNCLVKRALESGLGVERSTPSPSSVEPLSRDGSIHSESSDRFMRNMTNGNTFKRNQTVYSSDEEYLDDNKHISPLDGALKSIDFNHKNRVPFPEYGGDIVGIEGPIYDDVISDDILNNDYHLTGEIHASNNTWEENWLFQKKRIKSVQSVPVPMLVPNSNTEYRAMIGDRDADDTTDLSEAGSDSEDCCLEDVIKNVLVNSKTLIGGKNLGSLLDLAEDVNENGELITPIIQEPINDPFDTLTNAKEKSNEVNVKITSKTSKETVPMLVEIDSGPLNKAEFGVSEIHRGLSSPEFESIMNDDSMKRLSSNSSDIEDFDLNPNPTSESENINNDELVSINLNEATNLDIVDCRISNGDDLHSLQQKESEYSETIALPVQRHMDSLKRLSRNMETIQTPAPRSKDIDTLAAISNNKEEDHEETFNGEPNIDIPELHPDSIAVREKQKWLNAVEMPNNPYSAEAIKKRLTQKNTSIYDIITNGIPNEKTEPSPLKNTISPPVALKDTSIQAEDTPQFKKYGRDYYIKESKLSKASDMSTAFLQENNSIEIKDTLVGRESPSLIIFNNQIEIINQNDEPEINEHNDDNDYDIYSARPVIVDSEDLGNITTNVASFGDDISIDYTYLKESQSDDSSITRKNDKEPKMELANWNMSDNLSDSFSSMEGIRIYNVQSGQVLSDKNNETYNLDDSEYNMLDNSISDKNYDCVEKFSEREELTQTELPKVKDLAKMFTKEPKEEKTQKHPPRRKKLSIQDPGTEFTNKHISHLTGKQPMHMHSLTARSISKEFRDELKLSMPTIQKIPGGENEAPEGTEEPMREQKPSSRPSSPQPVPGTLKSKLAFFEKLKNI